MVQDTSTIAQGIVKVWLTQDLSKSLFDIVEEPKGFEMEISTS